jgi:hypothetical protein
MDWNLPFPLADGIDDEHYETHARHRCGENLCVVMGLPFYVP